MIYDLIVIGGGAAGVFAAIAAKTANPQAHVLLLEKTIVLLSKVRISGGGRCNVTHSCFDPLSLSKNYPRGEKELLGPFHRFQPADTIKWFEERDVFLKKENDGRMFPITDSSETIIDCLLSEAKRVGVKIQLKQKITAISKDNSLHFNIERDSLEDLQTHSLLLATGNSPQGHLWAAQLGHTIEKPIPSLFTFNIPTSPLKELSGISVERAKISLPETSFFQTGPILMTHFGFSGPAVIKLSAWGARYLAEKNYNCPLLINWLPELSKEDLVQGLLKLKKENPTKQLLSENLFKFPKNLWKFFLETSLTLSTKKLADLSSKEIHQLTRNLQNDTYLIEGKTTNKEEFVTCGGVSLKEIQFKSMESKICKGLYFAGEILDIDGITGGFNFQNAWSSGFIAGNASVI